MNGGNLSRHPRGCRVYEVGEIADTAGQALGDDGGIDDGVRSRGSSEQTSYRQYGGEQVRGSMHWGSSQESNELHSYNYTE
ncbi:hypothetical protein ACFLIM_12895 [Nonomuraea sp. M3C6]|uniref:Uncharacterized protein n=1 Tax=Nonomuraea marmarensis TaxID=3351344 RepID=A0ABW7AAG1_9ACTN